MQAYAAAVKKLILNSKFLFTYKEDETSVLFEKAIYTSPETIADCLIFSKSKGLIGVEIKTAHDSKARLRRQLHGYTLACDYTWVLIHDTKLAEVSDILEDYPSVGIICYNEIDDELVPGIVRLPLRVDIDHTYTYDLAWYSELHHLLKGMGNPKIRRKRDMVNWLAKKGSYAYKLYISQWVSGYIDSNRSFSVYDFRAREEDKQSSNK